MAVVLDTSVAIPLRDNDRQIQAKVRTLAGPRYFSILTLVELEAGIHRDPTQSARRRARVDMLVNAISPLDFTEADARAYGQILASTGYSRRKVIDRMIAAQAIVRRATLVTLNPADFSDVPNLQLLAL